MNIPIEFFMDEERNGFFVPTQMKQVWANSLLILSVIDEICERHGITYYADWGTLLGAVRHQGYVPWDDDIDLCMTRENYKMFLAAAKDEMPEGFAIINYENRNNHWNIVARVANTSSMCFDREHLDKYYRFPYIVCVDVFVLDNLYREEEKEEKRSDEIKRILALSKAITEHKLTGEKREYWLREIAKKYSVAIHPDLDERQIGISLFRLVEQQMQRVPDLESDEVGQIVPEILADGKKRAFPKEKLRETVWLPFEFTEVPVPKDYSAFTSRHYGDYMVIRKGIAEHIYPYFESQKQELIETTNLVFPEFCFDIEKMKRDRQRETYKSLARECIEQLRQWQDQFQIEKKADILSDCQQLAIDLGTMLEEIQGEESEIVKSLEMYCEKLFLTSQSVEESQSLNHLLDTFETVCQVIKRDLLDRQTVVFFSISGERWKFFEPFYQRESRNPNCDVIVVPLPLYKKDADGVLTDEVWYQTDGYPKEISLTFYKEFDLKICQAERIYIQDVYDNENPILSIPPEYYSSYLREHCDRLIYIPPYQLDEFSPEDRMEAYNIMTLLKTPGIMNSDCILAQSEAMRECWIELLTQYAGEETREVWNQKISAQSS